MLPLPIHPRHVAALYVGILFGIVAGLCIQPFSGPLLWLLWGWLGLFFAVSAIVIALAYSLFGLALYRLVSDRLRRLRPKRPATTKSEEMGSMAMWDRWLDGVGG